MRAMPNLTTIVPADGVEVRQAMRAMVQTPGPVYLRLTRDPSPVIFDDGYSFELGKGVILREGEDVAIVGTGVQTVRALEAAQKILAPMGIRAYVLHLPTIKPLDEEAIVWAARRTGLSLTVEDHTILGGLGGAVAEVLAERHPTLMRRSAEKRVRGIGCQRRPPGEVWTDAPPYRANGAGGSKRYANRGWLSRAY